MQPGQTPDFPFLKILSEGGSLAPQTEDCVGSQALRWLPGLFLLVKSGEGCCSEALFIFRHCTHVGKARWVGTSCTPGSWPQGQRTLPKFSAGSLHPHERVRGKLPYTTFHPRAVLQRSIRAQFLKNLYCKVGPGPACLLPSPKGSQTPVNRSAKCLEQQLN